MLRFVIVYLGLDLALLVSLCVKICTTAFQFAQTFFHEIAKPKMQGYTVLKIQIKTVANEEKLGLPIVLKNFIFSSSTGIQMSWFIN